MDSDSDGSNEQEGDDGDDKSDHLFTVKPQFEGKAGEEVFVVLFADFVAAWNLQPYVYMRGIIGILQYVRLMQNSFNTFVHCSFSNCKGRLEGIDGLSLTRVS